MDRTLWTSEEEQIRQALANQQEYDRQRQLDNALRQMRSEITSRPGFYSDPANAEYVAKQQARWDENSKAYDRYMEDRKKRGLPEQPSASSATSWVPDWKLNTFSNWTPPDQVGYTQYGAKNPQAQGDDWPLYVKGTQALRSQAGAMDRIHMQDPILAAQDAMLDSIDYTQPDAWTQANAISQRMNRRVAELPETSSDLSQPQVAPLFENYPGAQYLPGQSARPQYGAKRRPGTPEARQEFRAPVTGEWMQREAARKWRGSALPDKAAASREALQAPDTIETPNPSAMLQYIIGLPGGTLPMSLDPVDYAAGLAAGGMMRPKMPTPQPSGPRMLGSRFGGYLPEGGGYGLPTQGFEMVGPPYGPSFPTMPTALPPARPILELPPGQSFYGSRPPVSDMPVAPSGGRPYAGSSQPKQLDYPMTGWSPSELRIIMDLIAHATRGRL